MKKRILSAAMALVMLVTSFSILTLSVSAASEFDGEYWYNQVETVEENREDAHATFIPYQDEQTALDNEYSAFTKDYSKSDYYYLLNGDDWDFKFAEKPALRLSDPDENLDTTGWNTEDWDKITVPSNWQIYLNEDGTRKYEEPIYTNQTLPWANYETVNTSTLLAPTVKNGVGHYQKTFTIPEGWEGRNIFISFQGVESAFYLWVDGQKVGYAEDSYTADDFNITPYLNPELDVHTISVQVYRWSTGSYLENQDFIRLSGIFRDVFLYSKDDLSLKDFFVTTDIDFETDDNGNETTVSTGATLNLEAVIRNFGDVDVNNAKVVAKLYDSEGNQVLEQPLEIAAETVAAGETATVKGSVYVNSPKLWFADDPNLYRLSVTLNDSEGNAHEYTVTRVGFREIKSQAYNDNGQYMITINNKRIVLRGANRHETDATEGRALSKETIINDLKLMKQYNINAIRMCHYPNNTFTYDLADELGLYICDEANVESHSDLPSGNTRFINAVLDRTKNMVERDKNHPSVVIWSLGNESTYSTHTMNDSYCFWLSTQWILERDPSRIRKYERDNRGTPDNRESSMVDVYSVQYPTVSWTDSYTKTIKFPFIWSEYAHSMGNGLGNFDEYWNIVRTNTSAQGGFIWDFKDQALYTPIINTDTYYATDIKTSTKGTINGSLQDGQNGTKALKGTIDIPVNAELNANSAAITLEAWVNPADSGSNSTIISKGDSGYTLKINSTLGSIEFFVDGYTKGTVNTELPDNLSDGTWKHIVGTCENGTLKVYYNGELIGSSTTTATNPLDTLSEQVGVGYTPGLGRNFNGLIDSVGVYRRALTESEIVAAYESGKLSTAVSNDDIAYKMTFSDEEISVERTDYGEGYYFGYGGDWGETRTDNDFCANGVVYADGTPKPALTQVKKTHQEVSFYDVDAKNGKIRIVNEFLNTDLSKYDISWQLLEDATVLKEGALENFALAPLESTEISLELGDYTIKEGSDYTLMFSVKLKEATAWADAGYEIAFEQFDLDYEAETERDIIDVSDSDSVAVEETEDEITVSGKTEDGKSFTAKLDKTTGFISTYTVDGTDVITSGPQPNYYKAPISNDSTSVTSSKWAEYKNAADYMTVSSVSVDKYDKVVNVIVNGTLTTMNNATQTISYMIYANGEIIVDNTMTPVNGSVGTLPRAGMRLAVADGFETVEYYGRGPVETYCDRQTGAKLGVYSTTVNDMAEKYVKPQNSSNRTDVRWMSLVNSDGNGVMISTNDTMEASATHYYEEDMSNKRHWWLVPEQDDTIVTIDYKVRGLGNSSCGGDSTLSPYQVPGDSAINQCFKITPVTAATDKMAVSKVSNESGYPVKGIYVDGVAVENFNANVTEYTITKLIGSVSGKPNVTVDLLDPKATVEIAQAEGYPGTAVITATSSSGITRVYTINFEITNEVYASDMEWSTDIGGYFDNARDMCSCGESLGVWVDGAKKYFAKGIGMHATATVGINIEGLGATNFQAYVGVSADQTSRNANHIYKVYLDGELVYTSPEKVAGANAEYIDIDVTGAKTITLYVDQNGIDGNDHAIWADAKFIVSEPGRTFSVDAPESVYKDEKFEYTITTDALNDKLVIRNEKDSKMGAKILSVNENEDGTFTYNVQMSIGTAGEGRIFTVYDGTEELGTFGLDVLEIVVPDEIKSVDAPKAAVKSEAFDVTVTTTRKLIKGRFLNEKAGVIGNKVVSRTVVDGDLVTVYSISIGTAGERTITFKADYDGCIDWPFAQDFNIAIVE